MTVMYLDFDPEDGVTDTSLKNARRLIDKHGAPISITLDVVKTNFGTAQQVIATFKTDRSIYTHVFNGFSWGYRGEGPHGLQKFLKWSNINVQIDWIASWDAGKGRDIK